MSPLGTIVGIDPSGRRLALVARGPAGLGRIAPPMIASLRADREQARFEEAEGLLREYVARHGLAGGAARLCVPASRVFMARVDFPPLRDRDMRAALEIEIERLFPVAAARLAFGWRRADRARRGGKVPLIVAAAPAEYLERWQEAAARAGLVLTGAIPSAFALASSIAEAGGPETPAIAAVLRDAGGEIESALLRHGEPFFSAVRFAAGDAAFNAGLEAAAAGLAAAPADPGEGPVLLYAPERWAAAAAGGAFRAVSGFESRAAQLIPAPEEAEGRVAVFELLGAWGAAGRAGGIDLLAPAAGGTGVRAARWAAACAALLAALLAVAWPGIAAWKARVAAAALEARVEELRPAVSQVESALSDLAGVEERISVLEDAARGRAEMLMIVKELTDRIPQGSWLTGLRVEKRKVEADGLSPSASELFPALSRDGRFRNVEFASPITRQPDNIERFQIRAEYVPPSPAEGGAR